MGEDESSYFSRVGRAVQQGGNLTSGLFPVQSNGDASTRELTDRSLPAQSVEEFPVALVSMPFGISAAQPSIQLALLRAIAEQAGFVADSYHLYLDLAARLSPHLYKAICNHRGHVTGEWLFSATAFGDTVPSADAAYFDAFPEEVAWAKSLGQDAAYLSRLRHEILPEYLEECLTAVNWGRYALVGFTSTYQQNVASLALARRIKERWPAVQIVFGGANMEGEMGPEFARAFPFLDYVVVGEGDVVFPALLRSLAALQPPPDVPGLVWRTPAGIQSNGQAVPVRDLNALPTPNYDEYFQRARRLGLQREWQLEAMLPFESSRGCWWGQKHHCTFCGLNGVGFPFRAKSPSRVLAEISELAGKHRTLSFSANDNILDMHYVKDFFAQLGEARTDFRFFYEVKANLTREQLRTLFRGGVRWMQPGIESLSTHVLHLMRKGTTLLQNVRLLKWCRYYDIDVGWNLLHGFPGETADDYRQELEVLRRIPHLQPPSGFGRLWLERFAPYYEDREQFPVRDVRPEASYRFAYPPQVDLDKAAYFFDYTMEDTVPTAVHDASQEWVREWQRRWASDHRSSLVYRRTPDAVFIEDRREPGSGSLHLLKGPWALAYEFCSETMHTAQQIGEWLRSMPTALDVGEEELSAGLDALCHKGLMVSEDGRYLSLALPANPNW